jgi:hypothetical protein
MRYQQLKFVERNNPFIEDSYLCISNRVNIIIFGIDLCNEKKPMQGTGRFGIFLVEVFTPNILTFLLIFLI